MRSQDTFKATACTGRRFDHSGILQVFGWECAKDREGSSQQQVLFQSDQLTLPRVLLIGLSSNVLRKIIISDRPSQRSTTLEKTLNGYCKATCMKE